MDPVSTSEAPAGAPSQPAAEAPVRELAAGASVAALHPRKYSDDELLAAPDDQLGPGQRRRKRNLERARAAEKRRADRAAKKGTKPAAAAEPKPAADDDQVDDDDRDDEQRAREVGGFWRLTIRLVSLLLYPFGWRLDALTEKECNEDVLLLAPLAKRHRWLDILVRYAALPYLLVERVISKARRRESPPAAPAKGAK
jgi:hypothetical protein